MGEESPGEALKEFNDLIRENPSYAPLFAQKAMLYLKMGDEQNAMKSLYQALRLSPADNDYKDNLPVLFDKNGHYEQAARLYSDLVEESYKGNANLPASRAELAERMTYIQGKVNQSN